MSTPEPQGDGDCFMAAIDNLMAPDAEEYGGFVVAHGRPVLRRPPHDRFWHAWNESADGLWAIDRSNGGNRLLPRFMYYALGNIDPGEVTRYTGREVVEKMLEYKHAGPWTPEYPPLDDWDDEEADPM